MMSVLAAIVKKLKGPEEEIDDDRWIERSLEVQRIRARINKLRNDLYTPRPVPVQKPKEVVEPEPSMDQARKAKEEELNALKRKLLGGK